RRECLRLPKRKPSSFAPLGYHRPAILIRTARKFSARLLPETIMAVMKLVMAHLFGLRTDKHSGESGCRQAKSAASVIGAECKRHRTLPDAYRLRTRWQHHLPPGAHLPFYLEPHVREAPSEPT